MGVLISLLVLTLVFGLIFALLQRAPIDANFKWFAEAILIVIAIIVLLSFIPGIPGGPWPWRCP